MDTDLQQVRHWRPPHSKITWGLTLLMACVGTGPFVAGIICLIMKNNDSGSLFTGVPPTLLTSIFYTIKQALISALMVFTLSPLFAVGLFFQTGKINRISVALRTLIFCLPSVVLATGLILAWGNSGLATRSLATLGINAPFSAILYSPYAIVFANCVMNLPFASLMIFKCVVEIPASQLQSAILIGLPMNKIVRSVFWPAVRPVLTYFSGLTFLLSLGSFGALSILGGGPESQTLELGIYQTIYYEGNWGAAAIFALAHTILAGTAATLFIMPQYRWLNAYLSHDLSSRSHDITIARVTRVGSNARRFFAALSGTLDLFILVPVACVFGDTARWIITAEHKSASSTQSIIDSLIQSLHYAIPAAAIATFAALFISREFCRYKTRHNSTHGLFLLLIALGSTTIPAMVSAFGLLALRSVLTGYALTTGAIIALHAVTATPYLINVTLPGYGRHIAPFDHARVLNGVSGLKWFKHVERGALTRLALTAFAIALTLSLSETTLVSTLGDPAAPALTPKMIQLMGHYRFGESAVVSSILIISILLPLWLTSRGEHQSVT